ncbi:unannotated protein [freshwater metagenome]|uniref:Unannotated protein n=1 Tax=freshwater metagenome TaxID=449393 RepID=A0A6J6XJL8_9ZZZZ|nr:SDR family NAD(P)-dependent oxidoreductase [Actinomycetota bacterium]
MGDNLGFDGQVVVITGAGRGLGREHALAFAERGASIVVNDIGISLTGDSTSQSPADELVKEIQAAGGTAVADFNDVSTPESAARIVNSALEHFGQIDVVVNNAGILIDKSFPNMDQASLSKVFDVHLNGSFWVTHAAWKHFKEQNFGRVIMTTSVAGYLGNFGQSNYGSAKAALIGLTKTLAIEGKRYGITVNAVAPGARTRMTEHLLGEIGDRLGPEFISPVVVALAHRDCQVSGEVFLAAGGRVARVYISQGKGIFQSDLTAEFVSEHLDDMLMDKERLEIETVAEEMQVLVDLLKGQNLS